MFAFIAFFIIPVFVVLLRHKVLNISITEYIKLIVEYVLTASTVAFGTFLIGNYIVFRSQFAFTSFSSVQFFIRYSFLAICIGTVATFVERYLKNQVGTTRIKVLCDIAVSNLGGILSSVQYKVDSFKMKISQNKILNSILVKEGSYYFWLVVVSVVSFIFLFLRARYGLDMTDDAWYTADPYWVARGAIPYVNNWTQAPGFTLPLFVIHWLYIKINAGNDGIILFSRIIFCAWKTIVTSFSFLLLKKAGIKMPVILVLPLAILSPYQTYAINYDTIGVAYVLLCFSILAVTINIEDGRSLKNKKTFWWGLLSGILAGRCVIGTPFTAIAVVLMCILLLLIKKFRVLAGFLSGCFLATAIVLSYCFFRGGLNNVVIGFQYWIKDLGYWNTLEKYGVPVFDSTQFIVDYIQPAVIMISLTVLVRNIVKNKNVHNILILGLAVLPLICSIYGLSQYSGTPVSLGICTKYGWYVPIICSFSLCDGSKSKKLEYLAYLAVTYFVIYLLQGYISAYGFNSRSYWNYTAFIVGIYSVYSVTKEVLTENNLSISMTAYPIIICFIVTYFMVGGSYKYVYRDLPISSLNERVSEGVWKGCYTTAIRADAVSNIEKYMRSKTKEDDQVLCWGLWPSFMNLLHNGNLCAASPLGTGQKNGFDYWHMYQVVPNKIFVNIDYEDGKKIMSEKFNVWIFITMFYEEKDSFSYESYNDSGEPVFYRIIEYDISDYSGALLYVDDMATEVFEP